MPVPPKVHDPKVSSLFADHFREGPAYRTTRPTGSSSWLLMATASGLGEVVTPQGSASLPAGSAVLLPPEQTHDYGTHPDATAWELHWAHFHPPTHWQPWLAWPRKSGIRIVSDSPRIIETMSEVARLSSIGTFFAEALAMNALERALILGMAQGTTEGTPPSMEDALIRRAIQVFSERYAENLTMPEVANLVGLSEAQFTRRFRSVTGDSPRRYLERVRMRRAEALLALTHRSIQSISSSVGFESPFYFSLRFRKNTGMSPTEFRLLRFREPLDKP